MDRKRKTTIGLIGAIGVGAAILAPQAMAHPNLNVAPVVACEGASFTPTGIDSSGPVDFKSTLIADTVTARSYRLGKAANGIAQDAGSLPAQYVGGAQLTVTAEGKTYTTGVVPLDCRTPPPPEQATTTPPPPPVTTPPPTCAELVAKYPKAGPKRRATWGCQTPPVKVVPPPPKRHPKVCEAPARLAIVQQQTGTFYTEVYPLAVVIRNTTGAATPRGALVLTDTGLQNFVTAGGSRTERLVVPVPAMRKGGRHTFRGTMGFVGPEAFQRYFTTYARFVVQGKSCGRAMDRAYEG